MRTAESIISDINSNPIVRAISMSLVDFYGPPVLEVLNKRISDGQEPYKNDNDFRAVLMLVAAPWCTATRPNKQHCRAWPCVILRAGAGGGNVIEIIAEAFQKYEETAAILRAEVELTALANNASMGD